MTDKSTVQFTIDLATTDLEDEELNRLTVTLLQQMKDSDEFEKVNRVAVEDEEMPKDAKSSGGFILGILTAEVNSKNIKNAVWWLQRRLSGKPLKLRVRKRQGTEINLEANNREDFEFLMQQAEKFLKETEDTK
jgi:hypothetical protein